VARLVFATCAATAEEGREALLLAASIRTFAGALRSGAIWVCRPDHGAELDAAVERELEGLGVELVPVTFDDAGSGMPRAAAVAAAAAAETRAARSTDLLVWMDPDTLVVGEPGALALPDGRRFGWSPVHEQLIGAAAEGDLPELWSLLYRKSRVKAADVFPVTSVVDQRRLRAYFNAGLLVARPKDRLLRRWQADFLKLAGDPAFKACFIDDPLQQTFFHQAVLAATVLAAVPHDECLELPKLFNFPLHLIDRVAPERRPWALNDLVTCRYDDLATLAGRGWRALLRVDEPLKGWLDDMIASHGGGGAPRL
jgi:hypothetical protein